MNQIYKLKQQWLEIYSGKSRFIDMGLKFIVGLMIFSYINNKIGFMAGISNMMVVLVLSAACMFLPYGGMLIIALLIILAQVSSLSLALAGIMAVVFLILFIVYFRFTSDLSIVVVLTPIALAIGMPAAVPIVGGLLVGPFAIIPMSIGVIIYSLIKVVSEMANTLNGELSLDGILEDAIAFITQLKENKEIIFYIVVLGVTTVLVFLVKKLQVPHAWKIAIGTGYVVSLILSLMLNSILGAEVSYIAIIFGNLVAMGIGFAVEIFFLGVDYKKTEVVEFEDDEYHYYVKMVPKCVSETKNRRRHVQEYEEEIEEIEEDLEIEDDFEDDIMTEYERELAYEMDEDLGQGQTMIIESEEIERELRSNAHMKSINSDENMSKHLKANYEMLKKSESSMDRNRRNRRNRRKTRS